MPRPILALLITSAGACRRITRRPCGGTGLAAKHGNANAQSNLGVMYDKGHGVPQDYAEAVRWYRLAAEQGNANAQNNLGFMYGKGRGVPQDDAEAVRWYRLAAEQGNADAQFNLGLRCINGKGVPVDVVLAHMWFNLAAEQGNEHARENRDIIAEDRMTPDQIAEAERLAREWKPTAER